MLILERIGLPFRRPAPDTLLNSAGCDWDYQESPELMKTLHRELLDHIKTTKVAL